MTCLMTTNLSCASAHVRFESFVNITSFRKFFCTKRRRNICVNSLDFLYTLLYAPVGRQPNDLEAGQITKLS